MKYPDDQILMDKLNKLLTVHQYYLIPHLKSEDVSHELGIPVHKLSRLLNEKAGCSFNDYINRFRIGFACEILRNTYSNHFSCAEISRQSGFASRSVFYVAFHAQTGMTPSEFKKNNYHDNRI